ncbi:hypothetical protein LDVICp195 [lymphocystis disease virus-China]|uniref:Uncharacterized protein n=1 Tax=lymphocystis disease virus-China TaxID=256729 RepID=Q677R9_9VIRU|nr:hypothetical protein LDVICp195 [lymphocystis disease virus-China]AAU11038.1 hypothetical protein [lymphocystis disease virus-China]
MLASEMYRGVKELTSKLYTHSLRLFVYSLSVKCYRIKCYII